MASLAAAAPPSKIQIDRKEAIVQRREFDPAKPPAEMPPLKGNEAAQCSSNFTCQVKSNLSITVKEEHGRVAAEALIKDVQLTAGLEITIWLPFHPARKLVDHEEGHRQIIEKVYATADAVAREEAGRALDQRPSASAATDAEARELVQKKVDEVLQAVSDRYMKRVAAHASTLGDAYDQFTAHGTKMRPDEKQAIEQAFAAHPSPTTAPLKPNDK